jgi:hypothetical protein
MAEFFNANKTRSKFIQPHWSDFIYSITLRWILRAPFYRHFSALHLMCVFPAFACLQKHRLHFGMSFLVGTVLCTTAVRKLDSIQSYVPTTKSYMQYMKVL